MASPLFYSDIENPYMNTLVSSLEQYSNERNRSIFLLRYPKSDLSESNENFDNCLILLSPECKVLIVSYHASKNEFENYQDEIESIISYLYSKYEYRNVFGRFSKWKGEIIEVINDVKVFENPDELFDRYKVLDLQTKKNIELLIALCTGSINDIKRVKNNVPETLLDQVKQKIQSFDGDQTRFIYQELNKSIIKIQGLSGTGKTELLLHKIKELYQKNEEYKIFVTCHNKVLADTLKMRIPTFFDFMKVTKQIEWNKRLWCEHAWGRSALPDSGLYSFICDAYNINFYSYSNATFDGACKNAINELREKYPNQEIPPILDYVFIDECQDFKDSFFELCALITSKQVFIAGDIFQSIFAENIIRDYTADYFLTKCYRTDPKTLMFAHALGLGLFEETPLRWLSKENWEACGYDCEEKNTDRKIVLKRQPVRRFVDLPSNYKSVLIQQYKQDNICNKISQCIRYILEQNTTCTIDDICIILLDNNQNTYAIANELEFTIGTEFSWQVNKAYESKKSIPNTLFISNRNNVKGLEYPFVICVTENILDNYIYRNALYTMLTRSFLQSILLIQEKENGLTSSMQEGYVEIMNEQKMTINIPTPAEIKNIDTRFKEITRHKPLKEVLQNIIGEMSIDATNKSRLLKAALSMEWTNCSEDELRYKVQQLSKI